MASCSLGSSAHDPGSDGITPSAAARPADPDQLLLQAAVADMRALLAGTDATARDHSALDERVRPLARVLNRQLTVLGAMQPGERPTSRTTRPSKARIPADSGRAVAALRHDTSQAAAARFDDTLAAGSGPFARVLSAISAGLNEQAVRLGGPSRLASVPPGGPVDPAEARRLQLVLSAEHTAVYAYGVIGARGGGQRLAWSRLGYAVHRERRDVLISMIQASGVTPVAAGPGYDLPDRITGPAAVAHFARTVELRCCEVYARSVSETTADARGFCAAALTSCGNWSMAWGHTPQPFPGAPEL
jgi:Domain of unknown function (DUF4439)